MVDLENLLKQSENKGVNVFTHGEMLPAHGYPGLKKYAHLKGHWGTAWQLQKFEYAAFPGPVVSGSWLRVGCVVYSHVHAHVHVVLNFIASLMVFTHAFSRLPTSATSQVQTTNCLVEPRKSYVDRIFTTNATGFPGVKHIGDGDFSAVIAKALAMPGIPADKPRKEMLTGFGHAAVLGVAPAVLDAVSRGQLDRFVLIGGCDGSEVSYLYSFFLEKKC